jgi:hypothetical protein
MPASIEQFQNNPLLFPFFFVGIWVSVCFVISRMGWHSFATRYPVQNRPAGTAYNSPSSWFGNIFASYRNVVRVVFTETGIYFYAMFLFRAFHPPFLVPWTSVKRIERKAGLFGPRLRMDIEDASGEIHVLLSPKVERDLFAFTTLPNPLLQQRAATPADSL